MFQRYALHSSRLRTCLRAGFRTCLGLATPFLYLCLVLSLTWYEASSSASIHIASPLSAVHSRLAPYHEVALGKGKASHRQPSLLTQAPKLPSSARLRPENQDDDLLPVHCAWALAVNAPGLSPRRIDPVAWESGTPSFLLPSAHGLVPFAIPPPRRFA